MPADILIRQLEYLAALARERHFGRAAAACHASQPALSAALRKLERELGVTIIQRGHRFVGFTPEGQRVVGWAHRILAERDALRTDLDRMREGLSATLRIGAIPTAVSVAPLITERFLTRHPRAAVRIEALSSRGIDRRLAEFDLDIGLTYIDDETLPGARCVELYREHYLLLMPAGDPLAARPTVDWAAAARLPLCALTPVMKNRRIIDATMAAAGARHSPVVEADTVGALYAHLTTRRFSCVVAHAWLYGFGIPDGMTAVPLTGRHPRPAVGLVLPDREPSSIVAEELLAAIEDLDVADVLTRAPDSLEHP